MTQGQLGIITRFELRRLTLSAPGVLFLAFIGIFFLWLTNQVGGWHELLDLPRGGEELPLGADNNPVFIGLGWILDQEPEAVWNLYRAHPPVLLYLFAVMIAVTPGMALVLGTDQTGTDISRKHTRFLVIRANRNTLYIGKTLAVIILWGVALALGCAAMLVVCFYKDLLGNSSVSEVAMYTLRIYTTCFFYGFPFIALGGAAAALTGHPALGALVTFSLWLGVALMSWVLGMQEEALRNIRFLFPTAIKYHQISDDLGPVLLAIGYQLGYAALVFAGGMAVFQRRDL